MYTWPLLELFNRMFFTIHSLGNELILIDSTIVLEVFLTVTYLQWTFKGLFYPQKGVQDQHITCSTKCGTEVNAI